MFAAREESGIYIPGECYKMAATDAIPVACKWPRVGADMYWKSDWTKHNGEENPNPITKSGVDGIFLGLRWTGTGVKNVLSKYGLTDIHYVTRTQAEETVNKLKREPDKGGATAPPDGMQRGGLP